MPYDPMLVDPMRAEVTRLGVQELRTAADVETFMTKDSGTALIFVNSVCGCAAGGARPGLALALQHAVKPERIGTVFAGQDTEATAKARSYFGGQAPSSPAIALFRDGKLVRLIQRWDIEGRLPQHGIDTCSNNGYDYADVFTADGVFIDKNSDEGFKQGGRVLARGREQLATLVGGGSRGCKTKLVWTDWSHIMANHVITPSPEGATGRIYLVQLGVKGPGTMERHGGYEDVYVKTPAGWRIKSRTNVRNKAWHNPLLQTPDLN